MDQLKGLKGIAAWSVYNKIAFNLIFIRRFNIDRVDHSALVRELQTLGSLEAIQARLPELEATGARIHKSARFCIMALKEAPLLDQRLMFLEALAYSDLDDDEVYRLLAVHKDSNGIPYSKSNINNFPVSESTELMIQTLIECCAEHVDLGLVSEQELTDLGSFRIDIKSQAAEVLGANSEMTVGELLSLAIKKSFKGG
jgi:hypothetical protein